MKTNNKHNRPEPDQYLSYNYYYYVYCLIDMAKIDESEGYDRAWDKGIELYETFLKSEFNSYDKSELDCINDFLNNLKTK